MEWGASPSAMRSRAAHRALRLGHSANVGLFTIWAARKYGARTILAYEASPTTHECLVENVARHIGLAGPTSSRLNQMDPLVHVQPFGCMLAVRIVAHPLHRELDDARRFSVLVGPSLEAARLRLPPWSFARLARWEERANGGAQILAPWQRARCPPRQAPKMGDLDPRRLLDKDIWPPRALVVTARGDVTTRVPTASPSESAAAATARSCYWRDLMVVR